MASALLGRRVDGAVGGGAGGNRRLTYGIVYGMTKTTIYLPKKLKRQVEQAAKREKRSEADIIREAVAVAMRWRAAPKPTLPLFEEGLGDPTIAERVDELLWNDPDR